MWQCSLVGLNGPQDNSRSVGGTGKCVRVRANHANQRVVRESEALGRIFMPGAGTGTFSTNFPCNIPKTYDVRAVLMLYLNIK